MDTGAKSWGCLDKKRCVLPPPPPRTPTVSHLLHHILPSFKGLPPSLPLYAPTEQSRSICIQADMYILQVLKSTLSMQILRLKVDNKQNDKQMTLIQ